MCAPSHHAPCTDKSSITHHVPRKGPNVALCQTKGCGWNLQAQIYSPHKNQIQGLTYTVEPTLRSSQGVAVHGGSFGRCWPDSIHGWAVLFLSALDCRIRESTVLCGTACRIKREAAVSCHLSPFPHVVARELYSFFRP